MRLVTKSYLLRAVEFSGTWLKFDATSLDEINMKGLKGILWGVDD